jgi:PST family polysaccharide transporter
VGGQRDIDEKHRMEANGYAAAEGFSELPRHELRRRAFAGVFVAFSGGLLNLILAFGGNLALARLLTPHDFGVVAVGSTVILIASAFADGGLGAALIRRPEPPLPSELRTLTGIQLVVLTAAAALIAVVAAPIGTIGEVTALMVFAMPITSLQTAGRLVLSRSLRLRSIFVVDAVGLTTFYLWAISMVAFFGLGVWGLASAGIARAVAGTLGMAVAPAGGLYRPTFERVRELRETLAFGIRFQATWLVSMLREQGLNATTGVIAGVTTLGLWSLGQRLMLMPLLLQEAIGRVVFPTMAHVLAAGDEVKPLIERTARLSGTCFALLVSAFVAVAPAFVPLVFGEKWSDVSLVLPGGGNGCEPGRQLPVGRGSPRDRAQSCDSQCGHRDRCQCGRSARSRSGSDRREPHCRCSRREFGSCPHASSSLGRKSPIGRSGASRRRGCGCNARLVDLDE